MTMRIWDPFDDFRRADGIINQFFGGGAPSVAAAQPAERRGFPMDVVQEGDELVIRASLPGVSPEAISVTIEDGLLTIEGESAESAETREGEYLLRERRAGRFRRALRLPSSVDVDNASPSCENGVLTIALPKRAEKKARRLEIKAG